MMKANPPIQNDLLVMNKSRNKLLKGLPVIQEKVQLAEISTSVLTGGEGPEIILLHGPGENSLWWMRVIPHLVRSHRVIVPDLPGHGDSKVLSGMLNCEKVFSWLGELIDQTCTQRPALIGHVLRGAIAARFAAGHSQKLDQLVLVDSLGLGKFRPSLRFAFGLIRFMFQPSEKNYLGFLPQCMYDIEKLKREMGEQWDHFIAYNLECANNPEQKTALKLLMQAMGVPRIPSDDLANIEVPTALIWGRHDKANKLQIAETASKNYGWPLYIIEESRDDPKLERPEEFVQGIEQILSELLKKA